ncbi:Integral membrane protein domain protein [Halogeometricum pallidum JCM 14848]|uniref:Integral membrane protein domain protein n=1 Tax=Halogeometricum pallidum JCM 14848 TaxID=1227487 RepID=M0DI90_HALPD|nr:EamA family transporter [Halogeometricum pallidum]ELZ33899.1 Integral membrane protein domain protein [Halogeometricum pallidum JCM 14848]
MDADRDRLLAAAPLLAAALWGGMYVVSKWGFREIPPLTLVFLRVALGAGTLYAVVSVTTPDRSFSRRDWRRLAGLALWLTAALTTQFVGTDLTNASQGALLTVLTPVFMIALGVTALDERLSRRKLLGTALALIGTLVVLVGRYDPTTVTGGGLAGVGLLLFSAFSFAGFSAFGKPLIRRYSALETVTYATLLSVPLFGALVPVEWYLDPGAFAAVTVTPTLVGAVLYLGVLSTAAAWYCWYKGMEYADASSVAVFFFAQPVVGVLLGAAILGERVGGETLVGGALLLAGVYVVNRAGESVQEVETEAARTRTTRSE